MPGIFRLQLLIGSGFLFFFFPRSIANNEPVYQTIRDDRGNASRHQRSRNKGPEIRLNDHIRTGQRKLIPRDLRHGDLAAHELAAEPDAKPVQGHDGPGVIDKGGGDQHQFVQPEGPRNKKAGDQVQAEGRRKCDKNADCECQC